MEVANRTIQLSGALYDYFQSVAVRDQSVMQKLRERTDELPMGGMQISPEQGQIMHFLIKLINARKALEIGTFTGYSALVTALALPEDGRLIACDVSQEWTDIGRSYWREAGVEQKIDLRLGPAVQTLRHMLDSGEAESFDFAFIDADKSAYDDYYELSLKLVRSGGIIALDNVLRGGRIADPDVNDEETVVMRSLNRKIHDDPRVDMCIVPTGDGMTVVRKR